MDVNNSKCSKEGTVVKVTTINEKNKEDRRCKNESQSRETELCHADKGLEQSKISNEHNCSSPTESCNHIISESADAVDSAADGFEIQGKDDITLIHTNKVSNIIRDDLRDDAQSESNLKSKEKSKGKSAVDKHLRVDTMDDGTFLSVKNSNEWQVDVEETETLYSAKFDQEGNGNVTGKQEKHKESKDINENTFETSTNTNLPSICIEEFVNYANKRYRGQVSGKDLNICLFEDHQFISCKISTVHDVIGSGKCLSVSSFLFPRNGIFFQQVYAIGFRLDPILLTSLGDVHIIKNILLHQDWRRFYLEDEHFRLATFGLSAIDFDKGVTLRLAAWGYFYDVDGRVKCSNCENNDRSEAANVIGLHSPNCIAQFSRERVGRSIAEYYGAPSTDWLVPSGQNLPEQDGIGNFIDISIRRETFHIGGTQQVTQDTPVTPDEQQYLREGSTVRTQDCVSQHSPDPAGMRVTEVQGCRTNEDSISQTALEDEINPGLNAVSTQQGFENQVAYLHSAAEGDTERRRSLITGNVHLRSWTLCRMCRMRRRNIVFTPCGHFVVCDQCVRNSTNCQKCGRKVDAAYTVSQED